MFDYDGSNLFPRTTPGAFVSQRYDSSAVGIRTIGELIDTSIPDSEPEFVYRVNSVVDGVETPEHGQLFASKITDIPGLTFSPVLTQDVSVTNFVGNVEPFYPAGTPLEDIIIAMLQGGQSAKDVMRMLNKCLFTITVNGESIDTSVDPSAAGFNVRTLEFTEGDNVQLGFTYEYIDGYFYNPNGYELADFIQYNSTGTNADHFRDNKLFADASISSCVVMEDSRVLREVNNPEPEYNYSGIATFNVSANLHTYKIIVNYLAAKSQPYKSDGTVSSNTLPAGSVTYTIKIRGLGAYDVIPVNPVIDNLKLKSNLTSATDYDYMVRSQYDIDHDSTTGVWAGDTVVITGNLARRYDGGHYEPGSGYNVSTFNENNGVSNGKLPAHCQIDSVKSQISNLSKNDVSAFEEENEELSVEFEDTYTIPASSTNTTVKLHAHYLQSTVVPKKSNNSDSTVRVPAGTLVMDGSFASPIDRDVDIHAYPGMTISNIQITGATIQGDRILDKYQGDVVSGSFDYEYSDGLFEPGTLYNSSAFVNNNPGSYNMGGLYVHDANCSLIGMTGLVNGSEITSGTGTSGTVTFSRVTLGEFLNLAVGYSYNNSQYTPIKLSGRESSTAIPGASNLQEMRKLSVSTRPVTYHFNLMSMGNNYQFSNNSNYSYVTQIINDASTVHFDASMTSSTPDPYTSPTGTLYRNVGSDWRRIIAIAPADYNNVYITVNSIPQNAFVNATILTLPYSSTDNTMYHVFIDKDGAGDGYLVNSIVYQKNT
jgi:hypothetical protein